MNLQQYTKTVDGKEIHYFVNEKGANIEVERIEDELKPPNIKSPNVRIYSPKIPFVKLVFESYFDNGKARYYVLVPDYKYISGKY